MINYTMTTKQPRLRRAEPDYYGAALHRVMGPNGSNTVGSGNVGPGYSGHGSSSSGNSASADKLGFCFGAGDRMLPLSSSTPSIIWLMETRSLLERNGCAGIIPPSGAVLPMDVLDNYLSTASSEMKAKRVHGAESQEMAILRATAEEHNTKRAAIKSQYPQIRDIACAVNEDEGDVMDVLRSNLMLHDRKIEKSMQQYYFLLGQRSSIAFENKSKFLVSTLFEAVKSFPHLLQQMAVAVQVYQRGLSVRTTLLVPDYSSFDLHDDTHMSDVLAQLGDRRQGQCIPFYLLWNIVVAEISSDPAQQATDLTKHAVNMKPKSGQSVSAFIYEMDYIFNVLLNLSVPAQPSLKYSIAAEGLAHFSDQRFNTFLETLEDTSTADEKGCYVVLRKKILAFCDRHGDPVMASKAKAGGGASSMSGANVSASHLSAASPPDVEYPVERVQALINRDRNRIQKAGEKKKLVCSTCEKVGHLAATCRAHLQCTKCGKGGHEALTCRQLSVREGVKRPAGNDPRSCFKCGGVGHIQRDCPKAARSTAVATRVHLLAEAESADGEKSGCSLVDGSSWLDEVLDRTHMLVQRDLDQLGALSGMPSSPVLHRFWRTPGGSVVDLQTILDCGATNHATPQPLFFSAMVRPEPLGGVLTATGVLSVPDGKGQALGHSRAIYMKNLSMTLMSSSVLHEVLGFALRASRGQIYEMEDPDTHELKLTFILVRGLYRICPALSPWYHSPVEVPVTLPVLSDEQEARASSIHALIDECYTMRFVSVERSRAVAYLDEHLTVSVPSLHALDDVDQDAVVEDSGVPVAAGEFA